jgi:hypothetical protein
MATMAILKRKRGIDLSLESEPLRLALLVSIETISKKKLSKRLVFIGFSTSAPSQSTVYSFSEYGIFLLRVRYDPLKLSE